MMDIALGVIVLVAGGWMVALYAAMRAPLGYEDESGFHFAPDSAKTTEYLPGALPKMTR